VKTGPVDSEFAWLEVGPLKRQKINNKHKQNIYPTRQACRAG